LYEADETSNGLFEGIDTEAKFLKDFKENQMILNRRKMLS